MIDFTAQLQKIGEFGIVNRIEYPIATVSGLKGAKIAEILVFENGDLGEVFLLEKNLVQVLLISTRAQKVGVKVTRTDEFVSVPVGYDLLGQVIDPLGNSLISTSPYKKPTELRSLDSDIPGIEQRAKIRKPFLTGVSVIDMMIPLGYGQKELIVGDRGTGKTLFLLSTIKNQVSKGAIAIYTGIGRRKNDVKVVYDFLKKEKILERSVMVATTSHDSESIIYLSPFSAMSIAEYFRDQGEDVVIVFDDLSTHAQFYREISLLAGRFPGRDSYPGDIFYTHARLLERAGNFKYKDREVSITALPVANLVEGDFTGYIPTNLVGMTDGHIFFDSNIYYKGRRPSINILISVTRVGKQVATDLLRSINRELSAFLALYESMQNLSHFGAELSESVKHVLVMGDAMYRFFEQPFPLIIPIEVQLVLFGLLWLMFIDTNDNKQLIEYRKNLIAAYDSSQTKQLFQDLLDVKTFNEFLGKISNRKEEILVLCRTKTV